MVIAADIVVNRQRVIYPIGRHDNGTLRGSPALKALVEALRVESHFDVSVLAVWQQCRTLRNRKSKRLERETDNTASPEQPASPEMPSLLLQKKLRSPSPEMPAPAPPQQEEEQLSEAGVQEPLDEEEKDEEGMSKYERDRLARIASNKALMFACGIMSFTNTAEKKDVVKKKSKEKEKVEVAPSRFSERPKPKCTYTEIDEIQASDYIGAVFTKQPSKCGRCHKPKTLQCECKCLLCGMGKRSSLSVELKCVCPKTNKACVSPCGGVA